MTRNCYFLHDLPVSPEGMRADELSVGDEQVGRSPSSSYSEQTRGAKETPADAAFLPTRRVQRRLGVRGVRGMKCQGSARPPTRFSANGGQRQRVRLSLLPGASLGGHATRLCCSACKHSPGALACVSFSPSPAIPASFFYSVWEEAGLVSRHVHSA